MKHVAHRNFREWKIPPGNTSQEDDDDTAADDKDDEENVSNSDFQLRTDYSYVKPLRVIDQFSAYPMLTAMYKILLSIAVTSCSTERIPSRARIIKNLLRSTMQDDWFSSQTFENIKKWAYDLCRI
jgi:hAT family C-terminal dimerisation region